MLTLSCCTPHPSMQQYNGACSTPACFLKLEDGVSEQEMSLAELQVGICERVCLCVGGAV